MRTRNIIAAAVAALICTVANAIPASPVPFTAVQPDGTTIMLQRHGDEFFNWTTIAGTDQVVKQDQDGWWRPSTINPEARKNAIARRKAANSTRPRTHTDNAMTHGERHIPVFLVQFTDVTFKTTDANAKFTALLNQEGYSANGGTGSVRDFYFDNSDGQFIPVFDVYGPVDLPNNMAYYGKNDSDDNDTRPEEALIHAAKALDAEVDFSKYDYDNDGFVDMALFYYAGYNEAEGGPANSIWPHQWNLQYTSLGRSSVFDGKRFDAYFCTSELSGNDSSGSNMCGIGTTCHEFAHSLGLPDFYDTDYKTNGTAGGLYYFSTMDSGAYLNDGRTPPYFNAEERILLGWMTPGDVPQLPNGDVSFPSIRYGVAYTTPTEVEGEYFLYECRDGSGWDKFLPTGLLIYHVDKSTVRRVGGLTPFQQWAEWGNYNSINAYGSHPCFYVIPAANTTSLNYTSYNLADYVFPGKKNVVSYTPVDWNNNNTDVELSNISYSTQDNKVCLTATYTSFQEMGLNSIADPGNGSYAAGDGFFPTLELAEGQNPVSVSWSYDGNGLSGNGELTLTAGSHTVVAVLTFADGTVETLELVIVAK